MALGSAAELGTGQKRELVDRVANSPSFQKSPRIREFLLYVAACTLEHRPEDARELQIALKVFNRRPDYNPGQDNIVRVEARSLRKRLESYFSTEGKDEPFVISMPRGSYAISFECRPAQVPAGVPSTPDQPPAAARSSRGRAWWFRGLLVAAIAVALLGLSRLWPARTVREPSPSARVLPFSALLDSGMDTYVVTSDTCLVVIQQLSNQRVTLRDYITGRYPANTAAMSPEKAEMVRYLLDRHYTDAHEMAIAGEILRLEGRAPRQMYLRSAHKVQLSDFQNHNAILLGGTGSNPWAGMYFDKLNFQYEKKDVSQGQSVFFRNRSPRPGEQAEYFTPTLSGQSGETYATVAFLPNVSGEGYALIIAGSTAEATAAAGHFVLDAPRISSALSEIGVSPSGPPRYFQLLLKAMTFPGGATQASVVAWRVMPDSK